MRKVFHIVAVVTRGLSVHFATVAVHRTCPHDTTAPDAVRGCCADVPAVSVTNDAGIARTESAARIQPVIAVSSWCLMDGSY